jgi:hypothetical protein
VSPHSKWLSQFAFFSLAIFADCRGQPADSLVRICNQNAFMPMEHRCNGMFDIKSHTKSHFSGRYIGAVKAGANEQWDGQLFSGLKNDTNL